MKSIPVGVFKTEFSDILQQVKEQGKSFIIEYGRSHKGGDACALPSTQIASRAEESSAIFNIMGLV